MATNLPVVQEEPNIEQRVNVTLRDEGDVERDRNRVPGDYVSGDGVLPARVEHGATEILFYH
jgi:hypothetical protein